MQQLEHEKARRIRQGAQEGFYQSLVMLGFGGLTWFGFYMYETFSSLIQQSQEMMGIVLEGDRPGVHPALAEDEAWEILHGRQVTKYGVMHPYVAVWWRKMAAVRGKIRDDGTLAIMPTKEYMWLKEQETILLGTGYIQPMDPETGSQAVAPAHPLDVVTDFVLYNKWYWLGIMGMSLLPAASHTRAIMEKYRK